MPIILRHRYGYVTLLSKITLAQEPLQRSVQRAANENMELSSFSQRHYPLRLCAKFQEMCDLSL